MSDNINILVKLFETLKESSDKNEEATQTLIIQQLDMVNHIKHLPIEDLKTALKEHAKDSKKEIDDCAGTVESTTGDIMELLRSVNTKITKMIVTVVVAFAVMTGGYFLIVSAANKSTQTPTTAFEQWVKQHEDIEDKQVGDLNKKLDEFMKQIKSEMDKRHVEDGDKVDESVHN